MICLRSPSLLTQLEQDTRTVDAALDANKAKQAEAIVRPAQDEQSFKDELNHDLMAFQLLQGGVDGFIKARDQLSLLLRQSFELMQKLNLKNCTFHITDFVIMTKIVFLFLVFGITDLTTYIIGTFLIVLLPGPHLLCDVYCFTLWY